jgi:hypothetical protein
MHVVVTGASSGIGELEEAAAARIVYPARYAFARHFPNLTRFVLERFTPPLKASPAQFAEGKR